MGTALDWVRSKATLLYRDEMVVTPDEAEAAGDGMVAGTYSITCTAYRGTLPYRMARELSGAELVKTETEHETLKVGTGYRGGEGRCDYTRRIYALVGANGTAEAA